MADGRNMSAIEINGRFDDQKGTVRQGKITGYNGFGVPCRTYTWVDPKLPELKGKTFEAFDDQIKNARARVSSSRR